ncbi:MAG: tRNA (uridine(34)/cytosine(34)/5-carboxymethylaminomethyluridine(34)-2'-O)-methyltransferase TrmL [Betaproteobacteria bacterium]|nr:tRNA (uridine(34)/cytosine(34)/5-carboxymethylaminomethyluridine(34)-2'-O)-methyltransferase TrmL [Betaproteobacteria bacterium]
MFHIVLYQPEIPPNTGNVIRLCANAGCCLHLIEPLGFSMDDRQLRRAGLDYHEYVRVQTHTDWSACLQHLQGGRMFALSSKADTPFAQARFQPGDVFVFGAETRGLPADILEQFAPDLRIRLPMRPECRSLNLSNSVAIVVYEAWRQNGFAGGA